MRGVYGCLRRIVRMIPAVVALAAGPLVGSPVADPLDAPVHATWKGMTLSAVADRLASAAAWPVVIDRRVDPTARITAESDGDTVGEVLDEITRQADCDWVPLASSVRIVAKGMGRRIAAADAERRSFVAKLPEQTASVLRRSGPLAWEAAATPQEIVRRLADEGGLSIEALERLPHDHLPAASLPPMPLADRFDLVLAHYDFRIARGGSPGSLQLVPLGAEAVASAAATAPAFPRTRRPARAVTSVDRYTLRTEAPLDELLRTLAARFGVELALDRDSLSGKGIAPGDIVKLSVENLPRAQLLDAILAPRGLEWSIRDGRLNVR